MPISLIVTVESVKFIQAIIIEKDRSLYTEKIDAHCKVQSSNLNEELGQIEFIFSDKTGTLTRNEMVFKKLIVGRQVYGDSELDATQDTQEDGFEAVDQVDFRDNAFLRQRKKEENLEVLRLLAFCHSVIAIDGQYNATSPDELALTNFAKFAGVAFLSKDQNNLHFRQFGEARKIQLLATLDFDSTRKRMSVIIKDESGRIWLLAKGADNVIFERMAPVQEQVTESLLRAKLNQFAVQGLRVLLLAKKELSQQEFDLFKVQFDEAMNDVSNRGPKIRRVQERDGHRGPALG